VVPLAWHEWGCQGHRALHEHFPRFRTYCIFEVVLLYVLCCTWKCRAVRVQLPTFLFSNEQHLALQSFSLNAPVCERSGRTVQDRVFKAL